MQWIAYTHLDAASQPGFLVQAHDSGESYKFCFPGHYSENFSNQLERMGFQNNEMTVKALQQERLLKDMPGDASQELIAQMLCPSSEINLDATPLPEEQREELWHWTEILPDQTVTITV